MRRAAALLAVALGLWGCATQPQSTPEPIYQRVEVKVPTPVPCPALSRLGPEPTYPDTPEAIASATSIGELAALYAKGRVMRVQRLAEYAVAKGACVF